jgi:hypothetical protein
LQNCIEVIEQRRYILIFTTGSSHWMRTPTKLELTAFFCLPEFVLQSLLNMRVKVCAAARRM